MITETEVVSYLKQTTRQDLQNLINALETELGVVAATPQLHVPTETVKPTEQTEFDVVLIAYASKMNAIKAIRKLTGISLKEAKALADNIPSVIAEQVSTERAKEFAETLTAATGEVEIK